MRQFTNYIILALLVAVIVFLLYSIIALIARIITKKSVPLMRHLAYFLFIFSGFIILFATLGLTLFTVGGERLTPNLIPFDSLTSIGQSGLLRAIVQYISNILLFIPFGFVLPVLFKPLRKLHRTLLLVVLLVLFIEIVQYFTGRAADIDDLIANTIGAAIGYITYQKCGNWLKTKLWWQEMIGQLK